MTTINVPSFFGANKIGDPLSQHAVSMTPSRNILSISSFSRTEIWTRAVGTLEDRFRVWFELDSMYGGFVVPKVSLPHVGKRFEDFFQLLSISIELCSYVDVVSPVVYTFGFDRFVGLFMVIEGVRR